MKTLNDPGSTTFGAAIVLSVILAPFATAVILPFWVVGKCAELMVGSSK